MPARIIEDASSQQSAQREFSSKENQALKELFNEASALLQGLEKLKNEPGSKFSFYTTKNISDGKASLFITTNLNYDWHSPGGWPHFYHRTSVTIEAKKGFLSTKCKVTYAQEGNYTTNIKNADSIINDITRWSRDPEYTRPPIPIL